VRFGHGFRREPHVAEARSSTARLSPSSIAPSHAPMSEPRGCIANLPVLGERHRSPLRVSPGRPVGSRQYTTSLLPIRCAFAQAETIITK
jgi:hypothetical protein